MVLVNMKRVIGRVGVLGAGTMGARIAAHFANIGIPALLLDLDAATARKGLDAALKQRPAALFDDGGAQLITTGGFDSDLDKLADCDWVIEAVKENLEVKRALWQRVEQAAPADAILSTNTSGIPLAQIAEGFPGSFQKRFLGTHFFNPPRYLHLMELIPGPATDPDLLAFVARFGELRLGKGVVPCKDTPNFIGNRIGCFFGATVTKIALEGGYSVEETDSLTGALIGLPGSASFRLLDIVGLDVMVAVSGNLYDLVPEDPWRERFQIPELYREMMSRGMLGEKTGQGFYKRVGKEKEIHALNFSTFGYEPAKKIVFPEADAVRKVENLGERLRALIASDGRAGSFLWQLYRDYFLYSAERVPEISDRIVEVDRAMRWGYAHKLGPFEMWDTIGFTAVCDRMEKEGCPLPPVVIEMRRAGQTSFYANQRRTYFDIASRQQTHFESPGLLLEHCAVVRTNSGASLKDLGDGVLCVEFHSKMNTVAHEQMQMVEEGIEETARNFEALIIANQGETFCAGANLVQILQAAQQAQWDVLDQMIHRFQQMNMKIKFARKPVVAAPFAKTLGGGCEIALHAHRVQASAETYMGLVEMGVGVIPAGGGCKELLVRWGDARRAFEVIGKAQVSASGADARKIGFLTAQDSISVNPDLLVGDAKRLALELARGYTAPQPAAVRVGGASTLAMLKLGAWSYLQGGYISEYDRELGDKLAFVLSGGNLATPQDVSEQYLLDLEREVFLSVCGDPRTQARIQHTLKTGKPLRN
jgi:3-hydroxyacyl-CoA dehydrogenase